MNRWKEECFERICILASGCVWLGVGQIFIPSGSFIVLLKDLCNPMALSCDSRGKYFVIWEDYWQHSKEKILAILQSVMGKNERVYARNTQIQELDKKEAQFFLTQYHLLNACKAQKYIGLRYKGDLLALASFSKPKRFVYQSQMIDSFELSRYACVSGITVVGGLSRLIDYFVEQHRPCHLMTYVDCEWSDGKSFERVGFECVSQTMPITFYVDRETLLRKPIKNKTVPVETSTAYIVSNEGNYKFSAYFT